MTMSLILEFEFLAGRQSFFEFLLLSVTLAVRVSPPLKVVHGVLYYQQRQYLLSQLHLSVPRGTQRKMSQLSRDSICISQLEFSE